MSLAVDAEPVPIKIDEAGIARVGGTRFVLEFLIQAYLRGESAEEIAHEYDAVTLADVYAVIAFYLRHRIEVDAYMKQNAEESERLRREIESNSDTVLWRERLLAREADRSFSRLMLLLRFLADENFSGKITRGLLRVQPDLDLIRVQDTHLEGTTNPAILEWAAREGRIVLSHDVRTMIHHAYERVRRASRCPV